MGRRLMETMAPLTFAVIDFEYTTPDNAPPEPIEVAVQVLRVREHRLTSTARVHAFMKPPPHAPLTDFDTGQTGITATMLADQPPATEILAKLDGRFTAGPYLLVAHHAPAESRILTAYRDHCPRMAELDLLDTRRMARTLYPDLPSHSLDHLIRHLDIPIPPDRHRADADVDLTVQAFTRMIDEGPWINLDHLRADTAYSPRTPPPEQFTIC